MAARSGDGVRIAVRDEGRGIPADQQSRIFTKFFRGDAGATGITGTGLGLAVSREIVEAHGGSIGFDTDPGEGTTFWLELPGPNGEHKRRTTRRRRGDEHEDSAGCWRAPLAGILVASPWQSPSAASTGPATITINDRQLAVTRVDIGAHGHLSGRHARSCARPAAAAGRAT